MPAEKHQMHKSVQITLIVVAAIVILAVAGMWFAKTNPSSSNTISVNGQGTEKVTPDLISVYFNVETKGTTSKEAEDANSAIVSKLKSYITAIGFSENDLKTENYNIYPNYDYTTRQNKGYIATHMLKISFSATETTKITNVIDAGTNAGAGISYINFELSPALEQQYKTLVIQTASEDARVKAEAIASGFNKNLGKLVSVSLDSYISLPFRVYDAAAGVASAESVKVAVAGITPSEKEVSAFVTAVYKLS